MIKVKLTSLILGKVVMRFYLMIAVAVLLGFAQQWTLMAIVAGAIGASAILGVSFSFGKPEKAKTVLDKIIQLEKEEDIRKAS